MPAVVDVEREVDALEITPDEYERLQLLSRLDTFCPPDYDRIFTYTSDGSFDPYTTRKKFLRALFLCDIIKGVNLISGQPGAGKTMWMTMFLKRSQLYFGRQTLVNFDMRPKYGPHDYFDEEILAEEIEAVTRMVKNSRGKRELKWDDGDKKNAMGERVGSLFHGKQIGLDEGYGMLSKKRRTRYSLFLGDEVKQWRHLDACFCFIFPDANDADQQLLEPFVTCDITLSRSLYFEGYSDALIYNRKTGEERIQHIYIPTWGELVDSWQPIAGRSMRNFKVRT